MRRIKHSGCLVNGKSSMNAASCIRPACQLFRNTGPGLIINRYCKIGADKHRKSCHWMKVKVDSEQPHQDKEVVILTPRLQCIPCCPKFAQISNGGIS